MKTLETVAGFDLAHQKENLSENAVRLAGASISKNTRVAYARALGKLENSLAGAPLNDAALAEYLSVLEQAGKAPATCALVVAAVKFAAQLAGKDAPVGPISEKVLAGIRRTAASRGRGQAAAMSPENLAAILATAKQPRRRGRGMESREQANKRGTVDAALAAVLFQGGLRRSEVAALKWGDVELCETGIMLHVRKSKTNQEGADKDVRFMKSEAADAVLMLRPEDANPELRIFSLSPGSIANRFSAAARAAGIEQRLTPHSGRVGLASALTARGASTTETMLAGNWKSARMVAHYSSAAVAEKGAVAKYL